LNRTFQCEWTAANRTVPIGRVICLVAGASQVIESPRRMYSVFAPPQDMQLTSRNVMSGMSW